MNILCIFFGHKVDKEKCECVRCKKKIHDWEYELVSQKTETFDPYHGKGSSHQYGLYEAERKTTVYKMTCKKCGEKDRKTNCSTGPHRQVY